MMPAPAKRERVSFEHFMEWALYDGKTGYYSQQPRKIIGRKGDFFTASQVQPAFGTLMAALLPNQPVLELGPGRGEMREYFVERGYLAVGPGDSWPATWQGTIFANEFLDALPVAAGIRQGGQLRELLVCRKGSRYFWETGGLLSAAQTRYVNRYYPGLPEGARFEIAERALDCIRHLGRCLIEGTVWIIDYGWAGEEWRRFPHGSLIGYHRHQPVANVLHNPGGQDITAHVPFSAVMDAAQQAGFAILSFETLSQTIARALQCLPEFLNSGVPRTSLKTLLFGMGETFRTLVLKKLPENEKGPGCPEPHVV